MSRPALIRADDLLVARGLASSREEAERLLRGGFIAGPGRLYTKPGEKVPEDCPIRLKGARGRFVSRGGEKLDGALEELRIPVSGRVCLDAGAGTGGFTDCLLQRGAALVHAVDVGRGQLHQSLLRHPLVVSRERTHVAGLRPGDLDPAPSLIVADLAFISLSSCLAEILLLGTGGSDACLLVKPQFELPRSRVPVGGVVTDVADQRRAVRSVLETAVKAGHLPRGAVPSSLPGADGNREFFVWIQTTCVHGSPGSGPVFALDQIVDGAFH